MTPESIFSLANMVALVAWVALAIASWRGNALVRDKVCGLWVPVGFSLAYAALIGIFFAQADGGFGSLPEVQALFQSRWIALAGWLHYLAFDLFVGSFIARRIAERRMPKLLLVVLLPLTFLFGPIGLAGFAFSTVMFNRGPNVGGQPI